MPRLPPSRPAGTRTAGRSLVRAVRTPEAAPAEAPGEIGDALARIAAATRLSTRTGCSLAAVATAVEDDLRARARHRAELRAATAGPRASAVVLAGLPVLGLLMGSGVGADPWRVLTTTAAGQALLVGGVALEARRPRLVAPPGRAGAAVSRPGRRP